jgi:DNA-3-methyladenine glycosylase
MQERRGFQAEDLNLIKVGAKKVLQLRQPMLTNGPGKLVQAMGVDKSLYGHDLTKPPLYLSFGGVSDDEVIIGPRVGISQARELPLRHWIKDNRYVSRA